MKERLIGEKSKYPGLGTLMAVQEGAVNECHGCIFNGAEHCGNDVDNIKHVLQYTLDGIFMEEHPGIRAAERKTGIRHDSIWRCCHDKVNKTHGYIFKFKEI